MTSTPRHDELATIHAAAFTVPRPWTAAEIEALLTTTGTFLVHEAGGFLIGRAIAGEAELLTVAVHPEARRAGIARRLVDAFLGDAAMRGAVRVFLEVAADNRPARALYTSAGFTEAGRRRGYYSRPEGPAVDALILARATGEQQPESLTERSN